MAIFHKFDTVFFNTANKDGQKYLGKTGQQAWRVVTKINGENYGNMIYDEDLLPKKGQSYHIETEEKDGFKNWKYKLLSKKEQVLEQVKVAAVNNPEPPPPTSPIIVEEAPNKNLIGRGASFNLAFQYCLEHKVTEPFEDFEQFMNRVTQTAEKVLAYQDKFVNQ